MNNYKKNLLQIYNEKKELVNEFNDANYINYLLVEKMKSRFIYKSPAITRFKRENLYWCEQITINFSNGYKEVYRLDIQK